MTTQPISAAKNNFARPKKDAMLRARCSETLHSRLCRVAAILDKDASDLLRDAVVRLVTEVEARINVA